MVNWLLLSIIIIIIIIITIVLCVKGKYIEALIFFASCTVAVLAVFIYTPIFQTPPTSKETGIGTTEPPPDDTITNTEDTIDTSNNNDDASDQNSLNSSVATTATTYIDTTTTTATTTATPTPPQTTTTAAPTTPVPTTPTPVTSDTIMSISVASMPNKTTYNNGETLNISGLSLSALWSSGKTTTVNTGFTCSPTTLTNTGTQTIQQAITVNYNGLTTTFSVTVNAKTLTNIAVTPPTKIIYNVGESLNTNGMVVTATYSDYSTRNVTSSSTTTGFNSSTSGTKTITVSYTESGITKTATFSVTISPATLSSIAVSTMPTKTTYNINENLSTSGMTVTATYSDNSTKDITSSCTYNGFDSTTAGTKMITVSYIESGITKITTFNVDVIAPAIKIMESPITDFEYTTDNDTIKITKYIGHSANVIIPAIIEGKPVRSIVGESADDENVFSYSGDQIVNISIPSSVDNIYERIFQYLPNLESINVDPANNTYVSENGVLFRNYSYTADGLPQKQTQLIHYPAKKVGDSYSIPNSVIYIAWYAFYKCDNLTNITIPESVDDIGNQAFRYCTKLTKIIIPSSVTKFGFAAFADCSNLSYVKFEHSDIKIIERMDPSIFDNCSNNLIIYCFKGSHVEDYANEYGIKCEVIK